VPGSDGFSNVTATSIQANWTHNGNPSGTEYCCENTTTSQTSGWITDTHWVCGGLAPETVYAFRVKARNYEDVETTWCFLGTQMTAFTDNDGDGLPDSWEQQIIDDDPLDDIETIWDVSPDDDYDDDGSTNGEEFCANTDPTDDQSFFAVINIVRNPYTVSVFWKCVAGVTYRVEYCDEEMDSGMTWLTAQDGIGTYVPGVHAWTDDGSQTGTPPANVPHRYYRVMVYGPCGN